MNGFRRMWRRIVETTREIQWLLPVLGTVAGVLLALGLGLSEASPDNVNWTLTVSDGRGTLLGWLSILFAAFSIILALATLTIQNVIAKFSVRMYRLYQRDLRDRLVLALFAMTAAYIVTEQILLRSADPGDPVPATGFIVAFILLVATGIALIWYITTITRWFRVDRLSRRITNRLLTVAEVGVSRRRGTVPAPSGAFERPRDAVPIRARASGYLVEPSPGEVLAVTPGRGTTVVIARLHGSPVVRGEEIGWIVDVDASRGSEVALRVSDVVETESERGISGSIGYGIVVLVDIAIMALSPAVNDPNTAVEVLEEMTYLYEGLSRDRLGPYEVRREGSDDSVIVRSRTFSDYLRLGTEQILEYGKDDPFVIDALDRMAHSLDSLDLAEADRKAVEFLISRIGTITTTAPRPPVQAS